jgi:hypothetical protein
LLQSLDWNYADTSFVFLITSYLPLFRVWHWDKVTSFFRKVTFIIEKDAYWHDYRVLLKSYNSILKMHNIVISMHAACDTEPTHNMYTLSKTQGHFLSIFWIWRQY